MIGSRSSASVGDVRPGSVVGRRIVVTGMAGAGKSTLLAVIGTVLAPSSGQVLYHPLGSDLELVRPHIGWVAHDSPFDFASAPMKYTDSVRRFAQGTPSIPALYSILPGLQIIEEVGIKTIQAESRRRTEWMIEFASEKGWKVNSPRDVEDRGGSVMIYVEDGPAMVKRLAERKVFVDCRPKVGLRMSPHFFNTDEEVREAMAILAELI